MLISDKKNIDWPTMLIPFAIVIAMMAVFMIVPEQSKNVVDSMRGFFGDTIGIYYPILAIGCVLCTLYLALSPKYAGIKL
ncbi:MAG: BCCT family transporter, partial [Muribaculaceae bacterium]|nr:BCCT family transporter [Muribaculaceae bacterium]